MISIVFDALQTIYKSLEKATLSVGVVEYDNSISAV